jgi:hypothetical protein
LPILHAFLHYLSCKIAQLETLVDWLVLLKLKQIVAVQGI